MTTSTEAGRVKLTEAQRALVRVVAQCGPAGVTRLTAARANVLADFERARRAGYFVNAGYDTSVKADDWLNSPAGRAALAAEDTP